MLLFSSGHDKCLLLQPNDFPVSYMPFPSLGVQDYLHASYTSAWWFNIAQANRGCPADRCRWLLVSVLLDLSLPEQDYCNVTIDLCAARLP